MYINVWPNDHSFAVKISAHQDRIINGIIYCSEISENDENLILITNRIIEVNNNNNIKIIDTLVKNYLKFLQGKHLTLLSFFLQFSLKHKIENILISTLVLMSI